MHEKAMQAQVLAWNESHKRDYYSWGRTPLDALQSVRFHLPKDMLSQQEIAQFNIALYEKSCLGRIAQLGAIMEREFADYQIRLAEVWEDQLRDMLLIKLAGDPGFVQDPTFIEELCMYEEPHAVLMIDDEQYDPLSVELGMPIKHPKIKTFPFWEAVAANILVSRANLSHDLKTKRVYLQEAEKLCPGLTIVSENIVSVLLLEDKLSEAIEKLLWLLERRPCARTLFALHMMTDTDQYYDRLVETYPFEVIRYIQEN